MVKKNATKRSGGNASQKATKKTSQQTSQQTPGRVLRTNAVSQPKKSGLVHHAELLMDANCLSSLALPRAVAPYSTVRQTTYIADAREVYLFGTQTSTVGSPTTYGEENAWSNIICMAAVDGSLPVNAVNNTYVYGAAGLGGNGATTGRISMTPACITVNISNGQPLQTTAGMIYVGRMDQPADWRGNPSTWRALASGLLTYKTPRAISAAQLALDGLTISALPAEMNALSNFRAQRSVTSGTITQTSEYGQHFTGFGLIFVSKPNNVPLNYEVTVEWRIRFDSADPASSTHIFHQPSSERTWSEAVESMVRSGHGAVSLMERAATLLAWNRQHQARQALR